MASVWVLGHSEPRRLQETLQRKIRDCCMSSDVDDGSVFVTNVTYLRTSPSRLESAATYRPPMRQWVHER